jgi:hypothetical protein
LGFGWHVASSPARRTTTALLRQTQQRGTCLAGLIAVCHGRSCPAVPQPTPQRTAGQGRPWHTVGGHAKHVHSAFASINMPDPRFFGQALRRR